MGFSLLFSSSEFPTKYLSFTKISQYICIDDKDERKKVLLLSLNQFF